MPVSPGGLDVGQYMNPYTRSVVGATQAALGQQQGQQLAQQQAEAIRAGAFGGQRAGLQRAQLMGQQGLAQAQAIAPLYQQGYQQALQTAQQQQGVGLGAEQANRQAIQQLSQQLGGLGQQGYAMGAGASQQLAGLGTGAQQAGLQGAQAQLAAGQIGQQTQQAQDTAQYQQFLQERGYPFQVAQFLANIAMGTGALSGSTTTTQQPGGFFSDKRLKHDVKEIGETHDGQPIYSYKYNGDDRTQIGLMAQDVEKKHPSAVGLLGGYKTVDYKKATEDSERSHKDMGGGLMPDGFDPNSMGGAVTPDMSGEGFMRGGYVGGGLVGNDDWAQIIAANKAALGVYGGAQPMGAGSPGATGIVPQTAMPTPKLVTAGAAPQQKPSGMSTALQTGKDIQGAYTGGKGLLLGSAPTKDDPKGSAGLWGGQGELGGKNIFSKGKEFFDDMMKAEGGLIVPRHAYAFGGGDDSQGDEAVPYDPSDVMGGKDPMEGVLKAGSQKHDMLKPAGGGGGGGGGPGLVGGLAQGIGAAKGLFEGGSWLANTALPFIFAKDGGRIEHAYAYGGLIPRQGYATRGATDVPADYSPEADLPSPNAQEAGLVVERPDREKIIRSFLPINEQMESGGDPNARSKVSTASGLYQFTQPTWNDLVAKYPERGWTSKDIMNPQAQREMAPLHANDLLGSFERSGIDPSHQALRLGWAFGESGGPAFMKSALANPDAVGASLASPSAVKANPSWFFNRDGSAKTASETMNAVLGKFGAGGGESAPRPPADVGRAPSGGEGKKSLGDVVTSEGFIVPALGFLGSMLASDKRNLGQALGEGIMGGVGAYQAQRKMLPEVAKTEAEATQQNVAALNALSSGLKQYNAMNGTNLTLQQFAKLNPAEIAKYAGAEAAGAVSGQKTPSSGYAFTPEEMQTLVIKHPGGQEIPAYMDLGYLNKYKANYAGWGDNPYAKSQIAFADKQIERSGEKTVSSSGEVISTPGAIQTGQQSLSGQQRVAMSSDFEKKGAEFRPMSVNIETHLEQLADALQRFKTGADAASRANLDKLMNAVDPDHKFKSLHNNEGADYDKIIKSEMAIQIAQLQGLSARAPAAELNALSQQIVRPDIEPEAARQIVANLKAANAYQRKMYDEYDPEKYGYNISSYQKEFMDKNPYGEFREKVSKELAPQAGTQQQREQTQNIPTVKNNEAYNAIKSGATYLAPDGTTRRKP
jgi:hypothetical protein